MFPPDSTSGADVRHRLNGTRLIRKVLEVCDAVGAFVEYWGFRAIDGRVWTLLALRGAPMSQAEIAQTLGVSRSMTSMAVSSLAELGLVRATGPGRQAPYEAELDVWPIISDVLRRREWMLLETARLAAEGAREAAEAATTAERPPAYQAERLELLLTMIHLAQSLLRLVLDVRGRSAAADLGRWTAEVAAFLERLRGVAGARGESSPTPGE